MGTPLANPVYLSDSPRFLQRQRLRAARAAVSEHVPSWTCACQKCKQAARTRAVPGFGITAPGLAWSSGNGSEQPALQTQNTLLLGFFEEGGGGRAISSSAPPPVNSQSPKASIAQERSGAAPSAGVESPKCERRDYFWLLNAIHECCPAADPNAPEVEPTRKPVGSRADALNELVKRLQAESLVGKFGFKIPDTVILRNGKPRKRFSMDSNGRIQVENLKSSAQLLRVLRRYVHMAQRRPALALLQPQGKSLQASRSDPTLTSSGVATQGRNSFSAPSNSSKQSITGRGGETFREAAVLYYDDGAVRYMTAAEANKQMENASRLPKEFWQHIVMLQTPVQTTPDSSTRYITYSFDARSEGHEPQAPLPLVHRRSNSISHTDFARGQESGLVSVVPRKINAGVSAKKGRFCDGAGIVSGRFEFVLDEADGTLWLINAARLLVEQQRAQVQALNSDEDEQIRYFNEDEFRELMREQTNRFDDLKKRWDLQELTRYEWNDPDGWHEYDASTNSAIAEAVRVRKASLQVMTADQICDIDLNDMTQINSATGERQEVREVDAGDGIPEFELVSKNAADRLSGVTRPDDLLKYHQAEAKMTRHYKALTNEEVAKDHLKGGWDRALGLCIWFRRWVRVTKGFRCPAVTSTVGEHRASRSARHQPGRRPQSRHDPYRRPVQSAGAQRVRSAGHNRKLP